MQLSLCPSGFLNHLRGTDDRFLLAPAFAWPGIRKYNHSSRSYGQLQEVRLFGAWPLPSAQCCRLMTALTPLHHSLRSRWPPQPAFWLWGLSCHANSVFICSDHLCTLRWAIPASFRITSRSHFVHLFAESRRAKHGARHWEYGRHQGI